MSGVYSPGMEMPKNCRDCWFEDQYDGYNCRINEKSYNDFVPCHHCKNYDKDRAWCNLFLMRKVDGCPCGEEKEEEKEKDEGTGRV